MKSWSVGSLCLAIAVIVLTMAGSVALVAVSDVHAIPRLVLAAVSVATGAVMLAALRIRAMARAHDAALRRARTLKRRYSHFVNTAHEGIWMVDAAGKTVFANARLAGMFGCTVEQLNYHTVHDFFGDNPRQSLAGLLSHVDSPTVRTFDLCYRRRDGTVGWAIASGRPAPLDDGLANGTLLLLTDISERKAAELELAAVQIGLEVRIRKRTAELQRINEQLSIEVSERQATEQALARSYAQLRRLTAHLETAKEEERKRIALDIHDDLGQNLLALKIDVQMLYQRCGPHSLLKCRVGQALDTLDATIRSVRAIINDLHPSTLELGLPAATEWLVDQFEKRSGIACYLTVKGEERELPDQQRGALIFRIIQESLVNILHHARATQVEVSLSIEESAVTVIIMDDGIGIRSAARSKAAQLVLDGIRERVNLFGGRLHVQPRPSLGTCLSFRIPLANKVDIDQIPA